MNKKDNTMNSLIRFCCVFAIALGIAACGDDNEPQAVTIDFDARVGDEIAQCGRNYANLGLNDDDAELKDLRWYVSNVRLTNEDGEEIPVVLDESSPWQDDQVVLLDFENKTGGCSDDGTTETNAQVIGTIEPGTYKGLQFDIAVPFDRNHKDVAGADAPLNVVAMYWVWQTGHKFAKIDLDVDGGSRWNFHLGSTMCESGSGAEAPVAECGRPNRPAISLANFEPGVSNVVLDLAPLFADSDLMSNETDTPPGCQTFPKDANECTTLFPNIGLDFDTGVTCADCPGQSIFRVEPRVIR